MALQRGLLDEEDEALFLRWFHRMGIQRHLKVAGIFARLSHRDGKHRYLDDIPLTLKYLVSALEEDDELGDLYQLVVSRLN
jgi:aminoglycoside/choline kinase family phosphotransferase